MVRSVDHGRVVRCDDEGGAAVDEAAHGVDQRTSRDGVELRGGLVREQQAG